MMHLLMLGLACEPFGPGYVDVSGGPSGPDPSLLAFVEGAVDFGAVSVLEEGWRDVELTLVNPTSWQLAVPDLDRIVGDREAFRLLGPSDSLLSPGETASISLRFVPDTSGTFSAELAPDDIAPVALSGVGHAPVAQLGPAALQLEDTPTSCERGATLTLSNSGDEPLAVLAVQIESEESFRLDPVDLSPLEPDSSRAIPVRFAPLRTGSASTRVEVLTNDPAAPELSAQLIAQATAATMSEERFTWAPSALADILFVVDAVDSTVDRLENALPWLTTFFTRLEVGGVDWRVAVVNDALACHATAEPYISSGGQLEDLVPDIAAGLLDRTGTTSSSQLLELAALAAERTDPGDCLAGLLRSGAHFHVVLIGDRDEVSPSLPDAYVDRLASPLGSAGDLIVSGMVGFSRDGCGDGDPVLQAASTTGGARGDICAGDWKRVLDDVADASLARVSPLMGLPLSEEPVESTLELTASGRPVPFTYDASTWTVHVDGSKANLLTGAELVMRYVPADACPQ